jgi:hypothetical protein
MSDTKENQNTKTTISEEDFKRRSKELEDKFSYNYMEFKRKKTFEQPCVRTTFLTS